ncbi:MAG TPA: SagB/ThcOx family dehydrogenase, partial [Candidatus Binatia bacterium]|nr:SagB/ThcOx family dehydrogenase [Candidatus Binatia bacterium]
SEIPPDSLEQVIQRRGSTRKFSREPISFTELSTMLHRSTRGVPLDCLQPGAALNDLYLIVNAVEGLPSGAYFFHRDRLALELLKEGDFRREAGYLGLSQAIPADASVDVFFMTDLNAVLERMGNRGYRAAQLDASITAGKLYLSPYALGLGASGLTFFDDDVTEFFSPHAARKSVMFLIALGKSARRAAL